MTGWLLALGAAAAGAGQAVLLGRAARPRPSPLLALARVIIVGTVLFVAARAGHLGAAVAGWMVGLASAGIVVRRRLP